MEIVEKTEQYLVHNKLKPQFSLVIKIEAFLYSWTFVVTKKLFIYHLYKLQNFSSW